jgi:hypothetical protein
MEDRVMGLSLSGSILQKLTSTSVLWLVGVDPSEVRVRSSRFLSFSDRHSLSSLSLSLDRSLPLSRSLLSALNSLNLSLDLTESFPLRLMISLSQSLWCLFAERGRIKKKRGKRKKERKMEEVCESFERETLIVL